MPTPNFVKSSWLQMLRGRGLSKPEHWGLAEVLCVPQGSLNLDSLSSSVTENLRAALGVQLSDDEISRLFRILSPDLLGLAVGRTGITLSNSKEVVARLRQLVSRITDGVYQDDSMTVRLGPASDVLSKFQNVEALEKELVRQKKNVARLTALLEAVTRQAEVAKSIAELKQQKQQQADKLVAYKQFQKDLAGETQWRENVKNLDRAINAAAKTIAELDITAAPSAIGEVDACYFLEPNKQGRVVLTEDQRLTMKAKPQSHEA